MVLPLANMSSADRDLADGINVLVAEQLSTLPSLRVVHYTESMASRDKGLAVSEIVRRVQADGAISGSVNWTGTRAHVFVQLMRAGSSTPVWVKQFDVPARRAAELPRSVARDVAGALGLTLSAADELVLSGQESSAPEAFEAYLRARVLMRSATVPAVKQAIEQLQEALRLDPSHAPSLAALARCYILQSVSQGTRPLAEAGPLAREAAERALQLDSQLPEAHQALADVKFYIDWDWAGADERVQEARSSSGRTRAICGRATRCSSRRASACRTRCRKCIRRWRSIRCRRWPTRRSACSGTTRDRTIRPSGSIAACSRPIRRSCRRASV